LKRLSKRTILRKRKEPGRRRKDARGKKQVPPLGARGARGAENLCALAAKKKKEYNISNKGKYPVEI